MTISTSTSVVTGGVFMALLVSHDGHGVWANTRALELAGTDDKTPDPHNGRINRDARGRATGVLVERAGDLVTALLPPLTDAFIEGGSA